MKWNVNCIFHFKSIIIIVITLFTLISISQGMVWCGGWRGKAIQMDMNIKSCRCITMQTPPWTLIIFTVIIILIIMMMHRRYVIFPCSIISLPSIPYDIDIYVYLRVCLYSIDTKKMEVLSVCICAFEVLKNNIILWVRVEWEYQAMSATYAEAFKYS